MTRGGEDPAPAGEALPSESGERRTGPGLLARGSFWSASGYAGTQLIRFGGNLILWRLLFEEAFGVMALVSVFLTGLQMFSDVGIGPSLIQNDREDADFVNTAWTMQVLRGVAIWAVACAGAYPLAAFYGEPSLAYLVPVVGIAAVLNGFNSSNIFAEQRRIEIRRVALLDLGAQLGATVAMIGWALVHPSVWALAVGGLVGAGVKMIASHRLLPGRRNRFCWDRSALRSLVTFGRWIFLSTVLTFLALQSDRLIFGKLVPMAMLGVYSIAQIYATLPPQLSSHVVSHVVFPALSRHRQQGHDLAAAYRRVRVPMLIGSAFLVSCLLAGGPTMIRFLYDERAVDAGWIVQLLSVGAWFLVLESVNGALLLADGRSRAVAAAQGAKVLAMAALIPVGYGLGGFPGAIAGFAAADVFKYLASAWAVRAMGAPVWGQDAAFTIALAASAALGLLARAGSQRVELPLILEGLSILAVLTIFWGGALVAHRRSPRPIVQALGRHPLA
ncbi:MAG: oligosaccharide flippase family protein [Myxococcota bacterium]